MSASTPSTVTCSHQLAWPSLAGMADPAADFFATPEWFELLIRTVLPPGPATRLYRAGDPAAPTAVLPLLAEPGRLTALANYYACLYGPVRAPGPAGAAGLAAIFRHLGAERPRWPQIRLEPLDPAGPFYAQARAGLQAAGYWVDDFFCFGNWYLQVAGRSFDDYETSLPSRLRNTVRRARKKLERDGARIEIHSQPGPALEAAIADYVAVYNQSWKVPEPYPDFTPGLCRLAAARGWLRLGLLHLDDQPVAAQLWLIHQRRALIYKLAYVQDYAQRSVGSVLSATLMRHAIDQDQVEEVDYLTGDDAYKQDWMSHRRERRGLVAFHPRTAAGLAAAARHFGGQALKRWRRGAAATAPVEG